MSCPKALVSVIGGLLYWDGQKAHAVLEAQERAFGITWDERFVYVAMERLNGYVAVLDDHLRQVDRIDVRDDLRDTHQLFWQDGTLHVVESERNVIHCLGADRVGWQLRGYCAQEDDPHVNSVWGDGERFWTAEHWHGSFPKAIRLFDRDWRTLALHEFGPELFLSRAKSGLHNVYVEGERLYTLAPGAMLRKDLGTGKVERHPVEIEGQSIYLRGLARSDGAFHVGLSGYREKREDRVHEDAALITLDDDLTVRGVDVLANAGQVFDVRLLKGDRAHNGLPCPFRG